MQKRSTEIEKNRSRSCALSGLLRDAVAELLDRLERGRESPAAEPGVTPRTCDVDKAKLFFVLEKVLNMTPPHALMGSIARLLNMSI